MKKRFECAFEKMHSFLTPSENLKTSDTTGTDCSLRISLQQHLKYIHNLKNSCGLVAFSEYFFNGLKPLNHSDAEQYSKDFSTVNKHYLFACNFLTWIDQKDKSNQIAANEVKTNIDKFNAEIEKGKEILQLFNSDKLTLEEASNKMQEELLVTTSLQHLNETDNREVCMENKTFYTLNNKVLATYNKSTYSQENDEFLRLEKAFYKFGDNKDHAKEKDERGEVIVNNISTEICMGLGARKQDDPVNIHLIQSNVLKEAQVSAEKMPRAWCYVLCDAETALEKHINKNRPYVCTGYFNNYNKKEPICSFWIKVESEIVIDIYKID